MPSGPLDRYEVLEDTVVYVDEPFEVYLRARDTGALYAFARETIIPDRLWHWVLVPATSTDRPAAEILTAARQTRPPMWISLLEDHRTEEPQCSEAVIRGPLPH